VLRVKEGNGLWCRGRESALVVKGSEGERGRKGRSRTATKSLTVVSRSFSRLFPSHVSQRSMSTAVHVLESGTMPTTLWTLSTPVFREALRVAGRLRCSRMSSSKYSSASDARIKASS
jgi:hypothetical protein